MEKQDKYLKKIIQETTSFSLGDNFADSLMEKIYLEELIPIQQERSYELLWQSLAIVISFVALLLYLFYNPKVIVQLIQTTELLLSHISISPSIFSVIVGIVLIFGIDNLFQKRFPGIHFML